VGAASLIGSGLEGGQRQVDLFDHVSVGLSGSGGFQDRPASLHSDLTDRPGRVSAHQGLRIAEGGCQGS
jgi:hypothetical protein